MIMLHKYKIRYATPSSPFVIENRIKMFKKKAIEYKVLDNIYEKIMQLI